LKKKAVKFFINGLISTLVHYLVLIFAIELIKIDNIILANLIAGIIAIFYSFISNKYYVFKAHNKNIFFQVLKFLILYLSTIMLHTVIMFFLTKTGVDYHISFFVTSSFLAVISFIVNKIVVFK
jgi:putative flippase GtrA